MADSQATHHPKVYPAVLPKGVWEPSEEGVSHALCPAAGLCLTVHVLDFMKVWFPNLGTGQSNVAQRVFQTRSFGAPNRPTTDRGKVRLTTTMDANGAITQARLTQPLT